MPRSGRGMTAEGLSHRKLYRNRKAHRAVPDLVRDRRKWRGLTDHRHGLGVEGGNAGRTAEPAGRNLPAAADGEAEPGNAALTAAAGRILVEAHQMRADPLIIR